MSAHNAELVVTEYVEAWNDHDSDAIVETFAEGGTYTDPTVPGNVTGNRIGEHAAGLWQSFPDLTFDVEQLSQTETGVVLLQWTMRGTQEGPLEDLPPTGETVALPGTDVIEVGANGITSVDGYFDAGTMMEQLGLRVDVQPNRFGPVEFGVSARLDLGRKTEPGAFSLTAIEYRDSEDAKAVGERVREIIQEMTAMDGVIGAVFTSDGERGCTITAWENPDAPRQLTRGGTHKSAVEEMFQTDGLGAGGMTSVWTLDRMNGRMLRCSKCGDLTYEVDADSCPDCGGDLPEPPAFW